MNALDATPANDNYCLFSIYQHFLLDIDLPLIPAEDTPITRCEMNN